MEREDSDELACPDRQHTVEELTHERDLERWAQRWPRRRCEQDLPTNRADEGRGEKENERENELRVIRRRQRRAHPVEIRSAEGKEDAGSAHEQGR